MTAIYKRRDVLSYRINGDVLMLSLLIDAHEHRNVATADVAGAYLHAEMEDFTLLKMEGESVDIMCNVSEDYRNYVCIENGKKVLYLKLLKALYGCMQSALLWYELFSSTLQGAGFELNQYNTCIANKMINGKQCTITWFIDDNKISHVNKNIVTNIIKMIELRFVKMTVQIKDILDQVEAEKVVQAAKATRTSLNLQMSGTRDDRDTNEKCIICPN
jgi:hypothetical protein